MTYQCKIIADSISSENDRITTFQLTYPRYIHAELMTHRAFSRSASSSRAIPVAKLSEQALSNMVFPIRWGRNQAGMQASMEDLDPYSQYAAEKIWREAAEYCAKSATLLAEIGLHKQWANRMLEWFGTISVVVTATDFQNFFHLRCHPDAQPEINHLANLMRDAYSASVPKLLKFGDWHLPYIKEEEKPEHYSALLCRVSSARCARVSYLNHDGTDPIVEKDLDLYERLAGSQPAHLSPLEHPAQCMDNNKRYFNLRGWKSFRYDYEGVVK